MTTPLATVPQVLKLAGMFTDVPRDRMNGIGFGLSAIVAEYLCQSQPKQLSLRTVRLAFGLPLTDHIWTTFAWQEARPTQYFEAAVIHQPAKARCASLIRLRPTDIGLSNDDHPNDVIELASSWGYQCVPRPVLDQLFTLPNFRGGASGTAMVPLGDGKYAYVLVDESGLVREVDQMNVGEPSYATTWSVIMAC